MASHRHDPNASSQNVGNHIGSRSSIRQSKLFRKYESGNSIKELLGQSDLKWDTKRKQGAYSGPVHDYKAPQFSSGSGQQTSSKINSRHADAGRENRPPLEHSTRDHIGGAPPFDRDESFTSVDGPTQRVPTHGRRAAPAVSNFTNNQDDVASIASSIQQDSRRGAPRAQMISSGDDALWQAVTCRDFPAVQRAIRNGADVLSKCPDGWTRDEHAGRGGRTILHHAAWVGDLNIFSLLVEHGADFLERRTKNWAQPRGNTPFHAAAFYGRTDIVAWCLERGADVNMQGEQGHTPLHLASLYGYTKMAELLLSAGARTDMITKNEKTPPMLAKDDAMREVFRRFAGRRPRVADDDGSWKEASLRVHGDEVGQPKTFTHSSQHSAPPAARPGRRNAKEVSGKVGEMSDDAVSLWNVPVRQSSRPPSTVSTRPW